MSANYSLWAKFGLPSVFVNKVLLKQSHTTAFSSWAFPESLPPMVSTVKNIDILLLVLRNKYPLKIATHLARLA